MLKNCCNPDCVIEKENKSGYKVAYGFMLWACDAHAAEWKRFDEHLREYEFEASKAYQTAFEKWEATWEWEYSRTNPRPEPPNGFTK